MAVQTYLVNVRPAEIERIKSVARTLVGMNCLILMATHQGAIIAAFDDSQVELVRSCAGVSFVGGVTLQPYGRASGQLHRVFTDHLRLQANRPPVVNPRPIIDRNSIEEE